MRFNDNIASIADMLHQDLTVNPGIGERVVVDTVMDSAKVMLTALEVSEKPSQVLAYLVKNGLAQRDGKEYLVNPPQE